MEIKRYYFDILNPDISKPEKTFSSSYRERKEKKRDFQNALTQFPQIEHR